jgi:hypothetical protein
MLIEPPRPKVSNIPWEQRLRAEYLAQRHPHDEIATQARLGPDPPAPPGVKLTNTELRMIGIFRRYADAVVLTPTRTLLIEFALLPSPGDISLIEVYGRLFRQTPEYRPVVTLPLKLQIVGALEDPVVSSLARERGIDFILYRPAWLDEYLQLLADRKRSRSATVLS